MPVTDFCFVPYLPDLIQPHEYISDPNGTKVRIRIQATSRGVEVLGDSLRPEAIEQLLASLETTPVEQMLCG